MLDGGIDGFLFGTVMELNMTNRRIGCAWYDNSRNDLLRRLGCVKGTAVHHSLDGTDIPNETLDELINQASAKWPEPWSSVTVHALQTRNVIGIPIKEYIPDNLVNNRIGLVGDAAHVPAPITASGFNESLEDAVSLGKYASKGIKGENGILALKKYESTRLQTVQRMVQLGKWFSKSFGRA